MADRAVSASTVLTGHEVFLRARPVRRVPHTLPVLIAAVLVIALAGGAVWWFAVRPGTTSGVSLSRPGLTSSVGVSISNANRQSATPADLVPRLPGLQLRDLTMAIDTGVQFALYPSAEADLLRTDSVAGVVYRSSRLVDTGYVVLLAPATSPSLAARGVTDLVGYQLSTGEVRIDLPNLPATVTVTVTAPPRLPSSYQAMYRSGTSVVLVTVSSASGQPALGTAFRQMMDTVLSTLPAH